VQSIYDFFLHFHTRTHEVQSRAVGPRSSWVARGPGSSGDGRAVADIARGKAAPKDPIYSAEGPLVRLWKSGK